MDLTPEQEARRAALVERLHKLGRVPNDRAELMLEALAALVVLAPAVEYRMSLRPTLCLLPSDQGAYRAVAMGALVVILVLLLPDGVMGFWLKKNNNKNAIGEA